MEGESPRCISLARVGREEASQNPLKGLGAAPRRSSEASRIGFAQRPGSLWCGGEILFPRAKKTLNFMIK